MAFREARFLIQTGNRTLSSGINLQQKYAETKFMVVTLHYVDWMFAAHSVASRWQLHQKNIGLSFFKQQLFTTIQ